jgi:hypothetical protein
MENSEHQFPSRIEVAKNLANSIVDVTTGAIRNGKIYAPDSIRETRMDICKSCEYFSKEKVKCKKCGCHLVQKTSFAASRCPIEKWSEWKNTNE